MHPGHGKCQEPPCERTKRKPYTRSYSKQNQVVWDKRHDVADIETRVDDIKLIFVHWEVLFHTTHVGIAQVESVQVIHPVEETCERKHKPVDFHE